MDEPSFGELEVTEREEMAENDQGEPKGVSMQYESENRKGLKKT